MAMMVVAVPMGVLRLFKFRQPAATMGGLAPFNFKLDRRVMNVELLLQRRLQALQDVSAL